MMLGGFWRISSPNDFKSKKFLVQKNFGPKIFRMKIIQGQTFLEPKETLRQQNFESKEIVSPYDLCWKGSPKVLVKQNFGQKNFWSQKIKFWKKVVQKVKSKLD